MSEAAFVEEGELSAYRSSLHKRTFDAIDLDADNELGDLLQHPKFDDPNKVPRVKSSTITKNPFAEDEDEVVKSKPQGPSTKTTERKKTKKAKEKKKAKETNEAPLDLSLGATNITKTTGEPTKTISEPVTNPISGSATKSTPPTDTAVTTTKDLPTTLDSAGPSLTKNPAAPSTSPAPATPAPATTAPVTPAPTRSLTRSRIMTTSTDGAAQRAAWGGPQGMQNLSSIKQSTTDTHDPMLFLMLEQLQEQRNQREQEREDAQRQTNLQNQANIQQFIGNLLQS